MTIMMPRGDIKHLCFVVESSKEIEFTEIYITFKKSYSQKKILFQKRLSTGEIYKLEDGSYHFTINAEDTDDLDYGTYVFDIELVLDKIIKSTFVGELILTQEVTYSCNEGDV